jgi:hypothetical protein
MMHPPGNLSRITSQWRGMATWRGRSSSWTMVTDSDDGSCFDSTYMTHGGLGFCCIKRERTGMRWRLAHQKVRIGGGVAPTRDRPVRQILKHLQGTRLLLDLRAGQERALRGLLMVSSGSGKTRDMLIGEEGAGGQRCCGQYACQSVSQLERMRMSGGSIMSRRQEATACLTRRTRGGYGHVAARFGQREGFIPCCSSEGATQGGAHTEL